MPYDKDLGIAARWLIQHRNSDHGWGMAPGQASSLGNTAEAFDVLAQADSTIHPTVLDDALNYMKQNTFVHILPKDDIDLRKRNPRVRYVAFPLEVIARHRFVRETEFIQKCEDWLINARNSDRAWGDVAGDNLSKVFPTFLALRALQQAQTPEEHLEPTYHWLISRATPEGWSLSPGDKASPVATAYAVLCLSKTNYRDHPQVQSAYRYLLQTRLWLPVAETIPGTTWMHSPAAWVLAALAELGEAPYAPVIASGVRYINSLKRPGVPWAEAPDQASVNVRSIYWAMIALRALRLSFDPGIHAPRIDAERSQDALEEPYFLKFYPRSKWTVIVPRSVFRVGIIALFALSLFFSMSLYSGIPQLPRLAEFGISLSFLWAAWRLIEKRPSAFLMLHRGMKYAIFLIALASSVLGSTWFDIFVYSRDLLIELWGRFMVWLKLL